LGVRVLSTLEAETPSAERGRREADRAAPPHFRPGAEGYQLAYLGVATDHPALLGATITGDDSAIAAVVACNLAAVAAEEARNTLVVDLDPGCSASAALHTRATTGIANILLQSSSWADARVAARVGRDRTVDLVPFGIPTQPIATADLVALLSRDASRLQRHYDAIFVVARPGDVGNGLAAALPAPDVIYCARPGVTPLRHLRDE